MTHVPHQLGEDFPELSDIMARLHQTDRHFVTLSNRYDALNRDVHRAETDIEPTSDGHMIELRRARMALKDEIYIYVKAQAAEG